METAMRLMTRMGGILLRTPTAMLATKTRKHENTKSKSYKPGFVLSCFRAFVLSCFRAFVLSWFRAFVVSCFRGFVAKKVVTSSSLGRQLDQPREWCVVRVALRRGDRARENLRGTRRPLGRLRRVADPQLMRAALVDVERLARDAAHPVAGRALLHRPRPDARRQLAPQIHSAVRHGEEIGRASCRGRG